jgi:TatD DNase family protein
MPSAPAHRIRIVDSHCHVDGEEYDADRDEVVARARAAGVETMLIVGGMNGSGGHARSLAIAQQYGFPIALGAHPHEASCANASEYEALESLARERRIVAIGEIGLDYHYNISSRDVQRREFRRQLELACDLRLPVIVHTREAEDDTIKILEDEDVSRVGGVLHCFTGGERLARHALNLGLHISFSGIVAFPRAEEIRAVAAWLPADRLLVETDAPYLAPPPHRGKRNEPAFVVEIARVIAELRGTTFERMAETTAENFARLFDAAEPVEVN